MPDMFRVVARRSYLDRGVPRVGRATIGLYPTRKEAEDACSEFVNSQSHSFRADYDDCVIELVLEEENAKPDG
jgi:hypothetical protein